MSSPVATVVATLEPCPTISMTERWAEPPKISRAPAHAARGSPLPRAATPIVKAKGRYPTISGSMLEAPLIASRRACLACAKGGDAVPAVVDPDGGPVGFDLIQPRWPVHLPGAFLRRTDGLYALGSRKNRGRSAQPRMWSGVARKASTSARKTGQAGSFSRRMWLLLSSATNLLSGINEARSLPCSNGGR